MHPHRLCVIETKSLNSPQRSFTYKQIYQASNILAHHLHQAGVTHGDVVMIWAHRSVDLVVAIMGTLASGATISILDPLYPPTRQQVYLEVAQPCALINIARATDEAGLPAPTVRRYIDETLDLKTEVPSLRLQDDGFLSGGDLDGRDLFSHVRSKAASSPGIIVGPDSNPTLSFTSGSEGRPKGVLGRHFSLTKYFSWMSEKFNLSSNSKFTLLSGIAHDPVQRDIFTPLFLGAQLLVPSREDIQHEKLAEWFREYMPTVTHLTPAMGQILVGGATARFPCLDRAFFVGDVLTTRDCRSLRRLAVNCNIVNMYGTTETQRAVSYYEIPSFSREPDYLDNLKDTVPAGKGMENVQLLVVDRQIPRRLCGIGEVGEIYVRAAGLAEGYRGDKALNDEKFLNSWFVDNDKWVQADAKSAKGEPWRAYFKGPRDRLYRTGDLGRYLESGDVECTGRADDQVKIRGFRIELNDIDSNLGQNPLVRDCKTLIRRDKNEEPILVSYVVPELNEWPKYLSARGLEDIQDEGTRIGPAKVYVKRFRCMQIELRDHLKGRLPSYAIPATFILLDKLPLNPNGKVDKSNLPFPDIAEQTKDASSEEVERWMTMTEMERLVATKWAKLISGLNPKAISPQNNFFDLGGHSLLAQKMLLVIRKELGANISINTLYEFPTLAEFSARIDQHFRTVSDGVEEMKPDNGQDSVYAASLKVLSSQLPASFLSVDAETSSSQHPLTVFLTGSTGFLGAYLIHDLLERTGHWVSLIAHVRSAKDSGAAMSRLKLSLEGYGLWHDEWSDRLTCVVGDLTKTRLGMDIDSWDHVAKTADVVIHNGATVHWVKRYQDLLAANVVSTLDAMLLCSEGKPKTFTFVSSTSVLDTDYYIQLSEKQVRTGQGAVSEDDDMMGSCSGLGTGYGQTKWVSEQLVREAGRRGLVGSVVRPGYILGDSNNGICNTDDFLIRLLKGCVQLGVRPRIINSVNSVPVNHVARVVSAAALNPIGEGVHVVHVTGHPRLRMNEYLSLLEFYGFKVPEVSYNEWKDELENTRAPELNDENAVKVLKADAERWTGIDESTGYGWPAFTANSTARGAA
ncbi:hypothetical protein CDD82_1532 [Ophiocordyceps australis]|uniref:Alpha-aminoadipate reductase n=1 Tax=Ophiocordyceps australis TaxID=1399860 RepID=A0A2C5YGH7_9HYPO|nr:hypothetical protein CDD82_1532 [Ophiocordyceps australis]